MTRSTNKLTTIMLFLLALSFATATLVVDTADARSKRGGKSFKPAAKQTQTQHAAPAKNKSGGFMKGVAGGLLGGALGAMLFGSLFGGEGLGILPILLLGGLGFFLFRKFARAKQRMGAGYGGAPGAAPNGYQQPPVNIHPDSAQVLSRGVAEIQRNDPSFDPAVFLEIASDCFFQVQAGWMQRDLPSYRNLLGEQLASEYEEEFAQMKQKGIINKLESIAIRKVDMVMAGNTGGQEFVTVLFKANLLDYTVDENTGELIEGSKTKPVKFEEEWTWARPAGTRNWLLEGIEVVKE
ncbi:MAG: Tim44 domain-containing protein [Desulfobacterales bacterium]|nr:Tim44 domain-containing protein [Desulfobacterales bacterium]